MSIGCYMSTDIRYSDGKRYVQLSLNGYYRACNGINVAYFWVLEGAIDFAKDKLCKSPQETMQQPSRILGQM